jgi:SAM-dependent methyltransferase
MSLAHWKAMGRVPSSLEPDPDFVGRLDPQATVLDLGCGDGRTLAALAAATGRLGAPGQRRPLWAGADANAPSLAAARERNLPDTALLQADLARLPLADGSFDYGVMHAVLTTLDTPGARQAVLAEAARVLAVGLSFSDFLLTPEIDLYRERYEQGLAETGEQGTFRVMDGGRHIYTAHHYRLEELHDLFSQAGFFRLDMRCVRSRTRSGNVINGVVGMACLA